MADFNVNLSGPQGSGVTSIAPVRSQDIPEDHSLLNGIVDIFAKGLKDSKKQDAEDRKNAVIAEYVNNEKTYNDALVTGQWSATQAGTASRANYAKIAASYSEYLPDLLEARKGFFEGTEAGEAQKKVDRDIALREGVKKDAAGSGYVFYENMSKEAEDKTIDAYNTTKRIRAETEEARKVAAEQRAVNAEGRADTNHIQSVTDYQNKETARQGLVMIADKNYDAFSSTVKDLMANTTIPYEAKLVHIADNVNRIKQGLLAVSSTNPEMATPWQKLVDEMASVANKMLDPKAKAQGEAETLKAQFDALVYTQKIAAVQSDPRMMAAVVATELFKDPALFQLGRSAPVMGWLTSVGLVGPNSTHRPIIGTADEKVVLKTVEKAITNLNSGKVTDKARAEQEAINVTNQLMKETTKQDGSIGASALKELGSFYSSPAFGSLSTSGKIDMDTMQNVKKVFQVAYEPAVRAAITQRLSTEVAAGETLGQSVNIKFSGSGVTFEPKASSGKKDADGGGFIGNWIANGMRGNDVTAGRSALKDAESGLNALVRMGAHMEGTTDYGKYWEANKHRLVPNVFPDPAKLKEGQTIKAKNGKTYKYLGGDYNDIANSYMEMPSVKQGD